MLYSVDDQLSLITKELARGVLDPTNLPFTPCVEAEALLTDIESGKFYDDLGGNLLQMPTFVPIKLGKLKTEYLSYMQELANIINRFTGKVAPHHVVGMVVNWKLYEREFFVWTFCEPINETSLWARYQCGSRSVTTRLVMSRSGKFCVIANDHIHDQVFVNHYPELVGGFDKITDFLAYDALIR